MHHETCQQNRGMVIGTAETYHGKQWNNVTLWQLDRYQEISTYNRQRDIEGKKKDY